MRFLLTGGTLNPLKDEYLAALTRFGHDGVVVYPGDPIPEPNEFDALLLPGGGDIAPERFGCAPLTNGSEKLDVPRDELEFSLLRRFLQSQGKPIFGICRGMQVINVALGGTLWQDLPSQCGLIHSSEAGEPLRHPVTTETGDTLLVNSYHHQAVREAGRGLRVTARSGDGIAEALGDGTGRIRAVQWHPEKDENGLRLLFT
ncbi:MAG: gamma-glutamyl-gamma-aminobutyrate hydrolase family protein [Oscillospiraceae bacterium]|nr:gamma-glutamyl-gamma-aminobutyrate hydrolase family protein [Oscillospiraceae bacterium]